MYLIVIGVVPIPWATNDEVDVSDSQGNVISFKFRPQLFSLIFSMLSIIRAVISINVGHQDLYQASSTQTSAQVLRYDRGPKKFG